jgi:uncharacterized membrane protein YbhN (UPF0104 family)
MKRPELNRLFRTLGTLAAFALLIYVLAQQGWDEVWAGVKQIPPGYLLAALALTGVSRVAVAGRWHALLRSAGVNAGWRASLRVTFAGLFASNFLPTTIGGDVVRLAMALRLGWDSVVAAASLIVDRLVGMAGMGTAAPLGAAPILGSLAPLGAQGFPVWGGLSLWGRGAAWLRGAFRRVWQAAGLWLRSPRGLLLAFGFTWVHQLCVFGVNSLMLAGLGEPVPFWLAGGLWSFTYFVTLLPFSINGLGLQELSMTWIFSTYGGVSVGAAATAAVLVRTVQTLASLPGAAFLPDILAARGKEVGR